MAERPRLLCAASRAPRPATRCSADGGVQRSLSPTRRAPTAAIRQSEWVESGQFARIGVTFIEDRAGHAVVRLPNGSKTTVDYEVLQPAGGAVHFVNSTAYCQDPACDWEATAASRPEAELRYLEHHEAVHTRHA